MRRVLVSFLLLTLAVLAGSVAQAAPADVHGANCIDCHLPQQRDHDYSRKAITTKMVQAHRPALEHPASECGACHSADYILAPAGEKPQNWDELSAGITCLVCHLDHTAGEQPGSRELATCEQCHSALARHIGLGSAGVYNPQAELFRGIAPAFLETEGIPNRWKDKDCADCHMPRVSKDRHNHSFRSRLPGRPELSCGQIGCHEAQAEQYSDLARSWQRETDREVRLLRGLLAAKRPLSTLGAANLKEYQIAKYEVDMVAGDLSFGVHNIDYTRHLLADARRRLEALK